MPTHILNWIGATRDFIAGLFKNLVAFAALTSKCIPPVEYLALLLGFLFSRSQPLFESGFGIFETFTIRVHKSNVFARGLADLPVVIQACRVAYGADD